MSLQIILCNQFNDVKPIVDFFDHLQNSEDMTHFHPHPFTDTEANNRLSYQGKDLYYGMLIDKTMVGYGMLRGWDQGYQIPSLGIALHTDYRGLGLGKLLMEFLHKSAKVRRAPQIRLKVYKDNIVARSLYEKLGYQFSVEEGEQLVGYLTL